MLDSLSRSRCQWGPFRLSRSEISTLTSRPASRWQRRDFRRETANAPRAATRARAWWARNQPQPFTPLILTGGLPIIAAARQSGVLARNLAGGSRMVPQQHATARTDEYSVVPPE